MNFLQKDKEQFRAQNKKFTHVDLNLPPLDRITIDGLRYYLVEGGGEPQKFVSVTSVTSHYNKEKFASWRKRVGEEKANRITKAATDRGTAMHALNEKYLLNSLGNELEESDPLPRLLFNVIKPALNKIDNIYALESSMYSAYLSIAGTVDCIAEYDGVLSVIDFKTSEQPKPRDWIENYFVQAAAYAFMFKELTGKEPEQLVIIMACENSELEVYIEKDVKKYIKLLVQYIRKFIEDKLREYHA